MRLATTFVALVAAAVCAVPASAGGAANDPLRLVLQRADFPAKVRWTSQRSPAFEKTLANAGLKGKAAFYSADIARGSTETVLVSGVVIALPNAAQARRAFASYKNVFPATQRDIVRLTAYGDEQVAVVPTQPGVRADLRVRTGAVVWRLEIKWAGTDRFTRSQALAELKTYATKQKRRVGRG
ncbi:MAG TPA: hypothetical protein VMK83_10885 [Gaiellaceae bacterium]|nr:hypothetical protein [Gaiellaceae bacterium]